MKRRILSFNFIAKIVLLAIIGLLSFIACTTSSIPIIAETSLQALSDKLARDVAFGVTSPGDAVFYISRFGVSDEKAALLGTVLADLTATNLQSRLPRSRVIRFSPSESESVALANGQYIVKGEIKLYRPSLMATVSVSRIGSLRTIVSATRQAYRTDEVDLLIETRTGSRTAAQDTPRDSPPVAVSKTSEVINGAPHSSMEASVPKPGLLNRIFDDESSIEAFVGGGGTFGYRIEAFWFSAGYLQRLNTRVPMHLGVWLGAGSGDGMAPFPVGGVRYVIGDKRNGLAGSLNLGYTPSIGVYYRNWAMNLFMFPGTRVLAAEIGYSLSIR